jgi:hypothetical protein
MQLMWKKCHYQYLGKNLEITYLRVYKPHLDF